MGVKEVEEEEQLVSCWRRGEGEGGLLLVGSQFAQGVGEDHLVDHS